MSDDDSERTANDVSGYKPPPPFLSSAIRNGNYVFASGQIGTTASGELVKGPIENRVDQIFDNIEAVLQAHGTSTRHLVKVLIFITDYKDFGAINSAYMRRIPSPAPARSCIGAASLPFGTDIEIECIAAVPRKSKL